MAKTTTKVDWRVLIAVVVALLIIQCAAMHYGINGTFRVIIAIILAGIAGIAVPSNLIGVK